MSQGKESLRSSICVDSWALPENPYTHGGTDITEIDHQDCMTDDSSKLPRIWEYKPALGEEAVAAVEQGESELEDVSAWVKDSIELGYYCDPNDDGDVTRRYGWNSIPPDDPFLVTHREEVLVEATKQFVGLATSIEILKLINILSGGKDLSEELVSRIALADPYVAMSEGWSYPNFRFGKEHIDSMMSENRVGTLVSIWRLIEPECLQYAVDKVIEREPSCIESFIYGLPPTINISEQQIIKIASGAPGTLYILLTFGKLPEARSSASILKILYESGRRDVIRFISDDLLNRLSFAEIADICGGEINSGIVNRLVDAGRLDNEDTVYELLSSIKIQSIMYDAKDLPGLVQSCIFKTVVTDPDKGNEWGSDITHLHNLQEEDYEYLLDNIDDLIRWDITALPLREVFRSAGPETKQRFAHEIEPRLTKIENEVHEKKNRNRQREQQRGSEGTYFEAGNFRIDVHRYEEELSDKEIINALEHEHCVRKIGALRDIAYDTTRTNKVTCVESPSQMTTANLGLGVDEKDQVVCTEHEALQQLLSYLDSSKITLPDKTVFGELADNLSYIGEKEYAEAVKGIAAYWKWFLDKDSENQLYVDTVISSGDGNTKSDMYMFDRILEHFSDSEMEKYEGKLITKEADILQDDPSKIKVVLLDDWTISGIQLRDGYSIFARDHPTLAQSIEVQLIVASAGRVAMGIESASYYATGARLAEEHIPIVTRAYYLAHEAKTSGDAPVGGARITGSHSSVDFGFASDISMNKIRSSNLPLLASVVRSYRQEDYVPKHVKRLERFYETK